MKDSQENIIGLAMILLKQDEKKILIGKRRNGMSDVTGKLGFPGGHLQDNETPRKGCIREIEEETGLTLEDYKLIDETPFAKVYHSEDDGKRKYVTLYFRADYTSKARAVVTEPEKCVWWNWYSMEEIKKAEEELFAPVREFIRQGYNPFK